MIQQLSFITALCAMLAVWYSYKCYKAYCELSECLNIIKQLMADFRDVKNVASDIAYDLTMFRQEYLDKEKNLNGRRTDND